MTELKLEQADAKVDLVLAYIPIDLMKQDIECINVRLLLHRLLIKTDMVLNILEEKSNITDIVMNGVSKKDTYIWKVETS